MENDLAYVAISSKTGKEPFCSNGKSVGVNLMQFWQFAYSDLLGNTERGILAEFIVANALDVNQTIKERWDAYDLETPEGIKVEVKSSAYIQSWGQKRLSKISFGVRPTHAWDAKTDTFSSDKQRWADVYVFCVLAHKDQDTIDPLNLDQWEFYVLSSKVLDQELGNQKTIGLSRLIEIGAEKVDFEGLREAVTT